MSDEAPERKHQSWLEKQIHDLIGDGDVSHLPNAGQKLDWSGESSYTPPDMRMAYKMMKDANAAPEWIERGQELDAMLEKVLRTAKRFYGDYQQRRDDATRKGSYLLSRDAETRWESAQQRLRALIQEYNSKLLTFNITRPTWVPQRIPLRSEDLPGGDVSV